MQFQFSPIQSHKPSKKRLIVLLTAMFSIAMLLGCNSQSKKADWYVTIGNRGESTLDQALAVDGDAVYISAFDKAPGLYPWGETHYVQRLNASNGSFVWHSELPGYGVLHLSVISNSVFALSEGNGGIFSLNANTGQLNWRALTIYSLSSRVAIDRSTAFIAFRGSILDDRDFDYWLIAVDLYTGRIIWKVKQAGPDQVQGLLAKDGQVYFIDSGSIVSVDPKSGIERWVTKIENTYIQPLCVLNGNLFGAGTTKQGAVISRFDFATGQKNTDIPLASDGYVSTLLCQDDQILAVLNVGDTPHSFGQSSIYKIDIPVLKAQLLYKTNQRVFDFDRVADNMYLRTSKNIQVISATSGKARWEFNTSQSVRSYTVDDKHLYVAEWTKYLHSISTK